MFEFYFWIGRASTDRLLMFRLLARRLCLMYKNLLCYVTRSIWKDADETTHFYQHFHSMASMIRTGACVWCGTVVVKICFFMLLTIHFGVFAAVSFWPWVNANDIDWGHVDPKRSKSTHNPHILSITHTTTTTPATKKYHTPDSVTRYQQIFTFIAHTYTAPPTA